MVDGKKHRICHQVCYIPSKVLKKNNFKSLFSYRKNKTGKETSRET